MGAVVLAAIERAGYSWKEMSSAAHQVILFGSHAVGAARASSDVDVAFVGVGDSHLTRALDVIWIPPSHLEQSQWLGSEIATHIAAYGVWLLGDDRWRHLTRVSDEAIRRKGQLISHHVGALSRNWPLLSSSYQKKHVTILRRDLQRLDQLLHGVAVAPTPALDALWVRSKYSSVDLDRWIGNDAIPRSIQDQIRRLISAREKDELNLRTAERPATKRLSLRRGIARGCPTSSKQ